MCERGPVNLHNEAQSQCNGCFSVELEQKEIQLNESHSLRFGVRREVQACGDCLGRKPVMGKFARSKLNLLLCKELILTLDINLFNGDIMSLSAMLFIKLESRA